jgi:DNA-binding transcriptional LysR family regulator
VTNKEQVLASMADNLDDLYLLGTPPDEIDVVATPIMDNPIVVLAAPGHPLAREKQVISLARLAREPWVMREAGSGTRKAIERLFHEHGLEIRPRLELGSNEAIIVCSTTMAWRSARVWNWAAPRQSSRPSWPIWSCHALTLHQPDQFAVLHAQGFPIQRHWYAVYPAGRQISVVARAFLDFLLTQSGGSSCAPGRGGAYCSAECGKS